MQQARKPSENALKLMVPLTFCILLRIVAVITFRIDTVEVNGSSPFGPTMFLNNSRDFLGCSIPHADRENYLRGPSLSDSTA
jgi:hypothetical protein